MAEDDFLPLLGIPLIHGDDSSSDSNSGVVFGYLLSHICKIAFLKNCYEHQLHHH